MPGLRSVLPFELTTFIGRERELVDAKASITGARLVTLVGAGGSGKTRLALEVASELEHGFEHGAAFVELAALSDPGLVARAVLQTLGLAESSHGTTDATLTAALRDTRLLLLLDNCEHVIDACASLVDTLLRTCAGVRVLATSRERLAVGGEVLFPVPPLAIPSLDDASADAVIRYEAARLFVDRASRARPGFVVDGTNARHVAAICRQVDGLPLAIELAAAGIRSLSAEEIARRLEDRLMLEAARAGEPRHRTLRATIDWSHALLGDEERIVFRRLSVFSGGWEYEDAQEVCSGDPIDGPAVARAHEALIDKNLVVAEPASTGPTRYRFLETIRQYAGERIAEASETGAVRGRHFERFLSLAEAYDMQRMAGGSDAALPALAAHRDNFRAALEWGVRARPEESARLTAALDDVWRMIGAAEGWDWLQRTLPAATGRVRLRALLAAGMLAAYVPAYTEGSGLLQESSELARSLGDRSSGAWAELWLGRLAFFSEDVARARRHLESALANFEELGNALGIVRALALLGLVQGLVQGETADAEMRLERAIALATESADEWGSGYAHLMLGLCSADGNDLARAGEHFRAALGSPSLGPILGVPLQGLARVFVDRDAVRGMRLLGAGAGQFERTATLDPPFVRHRADATRERGERMIGEVAAARAFDEGRKMSADAAIAYALADRTEVARPPGGLTPREAQVTSLVARGLTNKEIAAALTISVRTVESHVDHVLVKLGLGNRTRIAAWAADHGIGAVRRDGSP